MAWPEPGRVKVVGSHDNGTMVCVCSGSCSNSLLCASASVNELTQPSEKAPYDPNPRPQQTADNASKREGNHARQQDSNLCSVDHGASAPRLTLLWGRPHETLRHLETGRVHDRGYRQQGARKRVRRAGGGLSYIYGCWSRVWIRDQERRLAVSEHTADLRSIPADNFLFGQLSR